MKKFILLLFLLISAYNNLHSSEDNTGSIRFRNYTVEEGLSTNTVYTSFQDRNGFLWFGTQDGINRFDGLEFEAVAPLSPVGNGLIYEILEGSNGDILIASISGLFVYSKKTERVELYHSELKGQEVRTLLPLPDNRIILSLGEKGLYLIENGELVPLIEDLPVSDLLFRKGVIYAAGNQGLYLYDLDNRKIQDILLEDRRVLSLYSDGEEILAGCDRNIYRISPTAETELYLEHTENVVSLLKDSESRLWVASETQGLSCYLKDQNESFRFPGGDTVISLYLDRSDNLWIGSLGGGLKKVDTHRMGFSYLGKERGLVNTIIVSLLEDGDGSLWIGTFGGGLFHYAADKTLIRRYTSDPEDPQNPGDDRIMGLFRDSRGRLWVGTKNKGLFYREDQSFVPVKSSYGSIYTIAEDSRGRIWAISQGGGVHIIDPEGYLIETLQPPFVPTRSFRTMMIHEGKIYLGSADAGLMVLNEEGRLLKHYAPESFSRHGLKGAHILSILMSRKGELWVGTLGGGLHRYDSRNDRFERYTTQEGLPNNTVYGILEDESGRLWISTNRGLSLFRPQEESFTNYSKADGLQGDEFNSGASYKGDSGILYFGGINGLSYFRSSLITENTTVPQTLITKVKVNNKAVEVGETVAGTVLLPVSVTALDSLELTQDHLVLTLEYRALHFSNPETNSYSYILEGFDPEWIDAERRNFSTYTNLPPGHYTFKVKSRGPNGFWSDEDVLPIVVVPQFYQTTWFRLLMTASVFTAVLLMIRLRLNNTEKKNRELEEMVALRTRELESALESEKRMRSALAGSEKMSSIVSLIARLAHNLNTPLGSTTTALSFLRNSLEQKNAEPAWLETCDLALDGTNRATQIVQQLSAASSVKAVPSAVMFNLNEVLSEYIRSQWIPVFQKRGIRFVFDLSEGDARLKGSISSLQETVDCLFNNVLDHAFENDADESPVEKTVSIKTVFSRKEALIVYRDNGRGIPKEEHSRIFEPFEGRSSNAAARGMGLFLVYNLIKIHFAGTIQIVEKDKGVCFQIKIPRKETEE
ncbi:MAG: two-component regulator propeller domain-containing protein [Spirochaetales bacterium]|nr:two-component regulator propeller domain-containing protein [Spirochaetales bacterium]